MITANTLEDPAVWEELEQLPRLGATDEMTDDRQALRFFYAFGPQSWVVWEYDPDNKLGFGFVNLGGDMAPFAEIGYIDMQELRDLFTKGTIRIPIERDISCKTITEGYAASGDTPPEYVVDELARVERYGSTDA